MPKQQTTTSCHWSRTLLGDALLGDALLGDALLGDALLGDALLGDALLGDALVSAEPVAAGQPNHGVDDVRPHDGTATWAEHHVTLQRDDRWEDCGAAALSGRPVGPPLDPPPALMPGLRWAEAALRQWVGLEVDTPSLLTERARLDGLTRGGTVSCGGATRLWRCPDAVLALSLARPEDLESVPALLEQELSAPTYDVLDRVLPTRTAAHWAERAALLGIPAAVLGATPVPTVEEPAVRSARVHAPRLTPLPDLAGITVVDLSSLWAGPLCARLLQDAGASVIKVEGRGRPDGARFGNPLFYRRLHEGQRDVEVDLTTVHGRDRLAGLIGSADVVIDASRPRALDRWELGPQRFVGTGSLRAWVSITGHGRTGPDANRPAFGDDAAVAGGLVAWEHGEARFCADAIADPLTGITSALAVICALRNGGSWHLDVAMARVAAAFAGPPPNAGAT